MKDIIIKHIETIVNSPIDLDTKKKLLLEIKNNINENLNNLDKTKNEQILKNYLQEHIFNEGDDIYTLERKYEIDRDFQDFFVSSLNKINIDSYGEFQGDKPNEIKEIYQETFNHYGYENDVFYIRPYNWEGISCYDCTCGLNDTLEENNLNMYEYGFHSKDCASWTINFYYKPSNLKIEWYKYPLRGAYSNQVLNKDILKAILEDCIKSTKGKY